MEKVLAEVVVQENTLAAQSLTLAEGYEFKEQYWKGI